jgi:hypothetical protein
MTNEEWKTVEDELKSPFGHAKLKCDGYEVALVVQRYKELKFRITIYVDGWIKGKYVTEDSEIRRKFMCPRSKYVYSAKSRIEAKKMKKKELELLKSKGFDPWRKITYWTPFWSSFRSLKSHLRKNCETIELIDR